MQLSVGDTFKSKKEAQNAIRMYAVDNNFTFETTDSTPKKYTIQCKERRTHGCDAIITAALRKKDNLFIIKKLKNTHNCPQLSSCGVQSSSRYIADELRDMGNVENETKVGQLINRISARRGIKIGYFTAWKAKEEVLGREVDESEAAPKSVREIVEEHLSLNPMDVGITCNMKAQIEEWAREGRYRAKEPEGRISHVINCIGPLDTADSGIDTVFIACHASLAAYEHSRKVVEIQCYSRYNELKEHSGLGFLAIGHDAFDSPYIMAVCYTPEYCAQTAGWLYFVKELLKVVDEGVLLVDYERDVVEEIEREIQQTRGAGHEEEDAATWENPEIEEAIEKGELDHLGARPRRKQICLFLRTRSLCKHIFYTTESADPIALVWSLCNSPDRDSFDAHYKKLEQFADGKVLSTLSAIPPHLWVKCLAKYHPLYGKNNAISADIEHVPGMFSLPIHDSICTAIKLIHDNVARKREVVSQSELTVKKATDKTRYGEEMNRMMERNVAKSQSYEVDVGRTPGGMCEEPWIDPRKLNDDEGQTHGVVRYGGFRFYVDLRLGVCSCTRFQEMRLPCSHACALILKVGGHPYAHIGEIYAIDTLGRMFRERVQCIVNEPIRCVEEKAPAAKRGPGRPRKSDKDEESEDHLYGHEYHADKENTGNVHL